MNGKQEPLPAVGERVRSTLARLNGWQRLGVVASGGWVAFVAVLCIRFGLPDGSVAQSALVFLVPIIGGWCGVWTLVMAVRWILRGFRQSRGGEDLAEQLRAEREISKQQGKLAEMRGRKLEEAKRLEDALSDRIDVLSKEVFTLRTLLAEAVRGTEESP